MISKSWLHLGVITALSLSTSVFAEQLPTVYVTAAKYAQSVTDNPKVVQSVTGETLQALGVKSLDQALTLFSTMHVVNASGVQSVFTQGLGSNQVKILLDGVNLKDPTTPQGIPLINRIDINFIDRIEIVTGGQSTLYGSGAMAGVINIITKKTREKSVLFDTASPGAHSRIGVNYGEDIAGWLLSFSSTWDSDVSHSSITSLDEKDKVNAFTWQVGVNKDLPLGTLDLTHRQHQVKENLDYNDGFSPIYDDPDYHSTTQQNTTRAQWSLPWNEDKFTSNIIFTANQVARRSINVADTGSATFSDAHYTGVGRSIEWQNKFTLTPQHTLLAGIEQTHEDGSFDTNFSGSTSSFPNQNIDILAEYLQWEWKNPMLNSLLGVRQETFGNKHVTTYDLNVSKELPFNITARYNASSGHREPSLYEKYIEDSFTINNPNLSAENSYSRLYSLSQSVQNFNYGITLFEYDVYDKITYTTIDPFLFTSQYENLNGKSTSRGTTVHLQASQLPYLSYLLCSYTHTNSKNPDGTPALRSPKDELALSAVVPFGKLNLGAVVKYRGKIQDTTTTTAKAYTVVDAHLTYAFSPNLKGRLSIYNIQDNKYFPLNSYQVHGREVFAGITIQI